MVVLMPPEAASAEGKTWHPGRGTAGPGSKTVWSPPFSSVAIPGRTPLYVPISTWPPAVVISLGNFQYFAARHHGLEPRDQRAVGLVLGDARIYQQCDGVAIGGGLPTCGRDGCEQETFTQRRAVGALLLGLGRTGSWWWAVRW